MYNMAESTVHAQSYRKNQVGESDCSEATCGQCIELESRIKKVSEELKSTRLIIELLQQEITRLGADITSKGSKDPQQEVNNYHVNTDWVKVNYKWQESASKDIELEKREAASTAGLRLTSPNQFEILVGINSDEECETSVTLNNNEVCSKLGGNNRCVGVDGRYAQKEVKTKVVINKSTQQKNHNLWNPVQHEITFIRSSL
jgi:hypothetical protein